MDQLKELNKTNPDEYKKIALSFIEEFKVQEEPHDLPEFKDNLL